MFVPPPTDLRELMARMMDFRYQVPPTGKIFLVLVMVETLFLLIDRVILSYHIADLLDEPNALWWAGVMVINLAFFLHLSISAIKKESKYELLACVIVSFVLSLRVVGDFLWRQDHCQQDKLGFFCSGALIVVLLFQVLYIVLGMYAERNFIFVCV